MSKLFFFDLETTGVRYWKNGIHQISGCIEIDGIKKEEFNYKVKPFSKAIIEDEALKIADVSREDLESYEDMKSVYYQLVTRLNRHVNKYDKKDKLFLVGYNNAHFDNPFFRAFFVQNGDKYFGSYFWSGAIDVMVLALEYLKDKRSTLPNFKLMTVYEAITGNKPDEDKLHDALYDIQITKEIYDIVSKPNVN